MESFNCFWRKSLDRIHAMRVLVRIADSGSFAETARQLNMSPPAVSRAVAGLEDIVGARLLTRTTRSVKLTEIGARYVEDCRQILIAIEEAEAAAYVRDHMTKPVVAYVAGLTAPKGRTMGHAGAIVSGGKGTAAAKMEALEDAGVKVAPTPSDMGTTMQSML